MDTKAMKLNRRIGRDTVKIGLRSRLAISSGTKIKMLYYSLAGIAGGGSVGVSIMVAIKMLIHNEEKYERPVVFIDGKETKLPFL